jgi:anaerobic selenocysteine-containing dehydrogenase
VHLSDQAVPPPGEARSDLEMWVDYARRMGFQDRSGRPIPRFSTPPEAFEAWKECSAGRPCDYTGLTYAMLRERGGIQWPVTSDAPDGTEHIYTDGRFNTEADYCETYGHDLATGGSITPEQHAAQHLDGRAWLRTAEWEPPPEEPTAEYPLALMTGRTVYHFHTRTKTGRTPQLAAAAPEPWVELHPADAAANGINEGDLVVIESARGSVTVPARLDGDRPGQVFLPFHYGFQPANALTMDRWDPVSKQPVFKGGAVSVRIRRA